MRVELHLGDENEGVGTIYVDWSISFGVETEVLQNIGVLEGVWTWLMLAEAAEIDVFDRCFFYLHSWTSLLWKAIVLYLGHDFFAFEVLAARWAEELL